MMRLACCNLFATCNPRRWLQEFNQMTIFQFRFIWKNAGFLGRRRYSSFSPTELTQSTQSVPPSPSTSYEELIGSMNHIRTALAVDCDAVILPQILYFWTRPEVLPLLAVGDRSFRAMSSSSGKGTTGHQSCCRVLYATVHSVQLFAPYRLSNAARDLDRRLFEHRQRLNFRYRQSMKHVSALTGWSILGPIVTRPKIVEPADERVHELLADAVPEVIVHSYGLSRSRSISSHRGGVVPDIRGRSQGEVKSRRPFLQFQECPRYAGINKSAAETDSAEQNASDGRDGNGRGSFQHG
jgi:hypothetical protein